MLQWRYDIESCSTCRPSLRSAAARRFGGRAHDAARRAARVDAGCWAKSSRSRSRSAASCCATRSAAGCGARLAGGFDVQRRAEEVPVSDYLQLAQSLA
jgi:hypothetical protein